MTVWDELKARGLIAQVTDEEEIKEMVNNGKATFYIGFDPTADSLHVGHFMALCLMKRLQMAGNKPIALLGGGTGMIGDPSCQHSGTTNFTKMENWILFLNGLITFAKQDNLSGRNTLESLPFLDEKQKLYFKIRTKKLAR